MILLFYTVYICYVSHVFLIFFKPVVQCFHIFLMKTELCTDIAATMMNIIVI